MKPKDWKPTPYADTKPQVYTEEEASAARLEQRKAIYEFFRHLMTLDSVALVLVATLIEKVFAQPVARGWVGAAVISFLASLVGGGFAYFTLLGNPPKAGEAQLSLTDGWIFLVTALAAFFGFVGGMSCLGWFFWTNWFR